MYREGGLGGVFMAARLSGLSPNLASRFTPGTLISSYEVCEAVKQGIAVPFRKSDPETARHVASLQAADRGGMMLQPAPGACENVEEIDFTSMYPTIIVQSKLSPETIGHQERPGFLPAALDPLLQMRIRTKRLKKTEPRFAGIDSILKWMLVTCFGYTGYRNAKFGRIEVHEAITGRSRDILLQTKEIAEEMGFAVLHGIVDCLWVQGSPVAALQERVEKETRLSTEVDHFDWIVFLPQNDGSGAYNRYYGRLADGSVKVRGIAARRHDTPEYIRTMQRGMLAEMGTTSTLAGLGEREERVREIYPGRGAAAAGRGPGGDAHQPADQPPHVRPPLRGGGCGGRVPQERGGHRAGYEDPVRGPGRPEVRRGYGVGREDVRPGVLPRAAGEGVGGGGVRVPVRADGEGEGCHRDRGFRVSIRDFGPVIASNAYTRILVSISTGFPVMDILPCSGTGIFPSDTLCRGVQGPAAQSSPPPCPGSSP